MTVNWSMVSSLRCCTYQEPPTTTKVSSDSSATTSVRLVFRLGDLSFMCCGLVGFRTSVCSCRIASEYPSVRPSPVKQGLVGPVRRHQRPLTDGRREINARLLRGARAAVPEPGQRLFASHVEQAEVLNRLKR